MDSKTIKPQWRLIWSLVALNTSIIISWIAYHNYQPVLLKRFELVELKPLLGYSKLMVMAIIPPLAGYFADKLRSKGSKKLPMLTAGVGITALIFMTVAATISPEALLPFQKALPVMIVLWLISMNLFYAPALATLEEFVPKAQFTAVMGVYILTSDMAFALEPAIILLVNFLGASLTFVTGGVLIGLSGFLFQKFYSKADSDIADVIKEKAISSKFQMVLIAGAGLGFIVAYLINVFPVLLKNKLTQITIDFPLELSVSVVLALTALVAFFVSKKLASYHKSKLFLLSFFGSLLSLFTFYLLPGMYSIIGMVFFIPCLAVLSVTGFPLAISNSSANDKMFSAGLFIAAMEIPDSALEIIMG